MQRILTYSRRISFSSYVIFLDAKTNIKLFPSSFVTLHLFQPYVIIARANSIMSFSRVAHRPRSRPLLLLGLRLCGKRGSLCFHRAPIRHSFSTNHPLCLSSSHPLSLRHPPGSASRALTRARILLTEQPGYPSPSSQISLSTVSEFY